MIKTNYIIKLIEKLERGLVMSVEKISLDELNNYKKKLDVEKKLPSACALISEWADPFMAEAEEIMQSERSFSISNGGKLLVVKNSQKFGRSDKLARNISIVDKNIQKLNKLPSPGAYVEKAVKKGKTEEQAMDEYIARLAKYAHNGNAMEQMTDSELIEQTKEEGER